MRTGIYIRVSSKSQDYGSQRDAIERAIGRDVARKAVWYSEKISAKNTVRPVLQRLLADVRAGKLDRVVVFKLDRLVRSGVGDAFKLVSAFPAGGVVLHAVADNLTIRPDREDIASECYVFALSLAARLELAAKNERIAAARVKAEAEGKAWGRPPKMTPEQIEKARKLHGQGRSVRSISMALKVARSTVARVLVSRNVRPNGAAQES